MSRSKTLLFYVLSSFLVMNVAYGQSTNEVRTKVNRNVVGIMAGSMSGTDMSIANDLGLAFSGRL